MKDGASKEEPPKDEQGGSLLGDDAVLTNWRSASTWSVNNECCGAGAGVDESGNGGNKVGAGEVEEVNRDGVGAEIGNGVGTEIENGVGAGEVKEVDRNGVGAEIENRVGTGEVEEQE